MLKNKLLFYVVLPLLVIPVLEIQPQVQNLILTDTTIATTETFIGTNSITAGPNFTISSTGNAAFVTGGHIYLRTGVTVVLGGVFSTVLDTNLVGVEDEFIERIPENFRLLQNYPNPFNPLTTIVYAIKERASVQITVSNSIGEEIALLVNEEKPAGTYEITWYAQGLPSGVYFYQLQAGSFIETRKMILMK